MSVAADSSRVYIDPPVFGQINPVVPVPKRGGNSYQEITALAHKLANAGWDAKAIVVKRKFYSTGLPASYDMTQPKTWGTISELRRYYSQYMDYYPFKVLWFDGTESNHWPDELFLIAPSKTSFQFDEMFKEQMKSDD